MRAIGVIIILLVVALVAAEGAEPAASRVLVVYDGSAPSGSREGRAVARALDLLGHFGCRAIGVSAREYRAGELDSYDAAIYLGLRQGAQLSEAFLADWYDSQKSLCWTGANLDQLADRFSLGRYGFQLGDSASPARPWRVLYHGQYYRREPAGLTEIVVSRPDVCRVIATARNGGESLPYAVRSGKLWCFADQPMWEVEAVGSHVVFWDQMHEILGEVHPDRRTALLCITDVSAETESRALGALIDYLQREDLPYAISVIPISRGSEADRGIALSSHRGLVGLLRGAQRNGASIVAHGLTQLSAGGPQGTAGTAGTAESREEAGSLSADAARRRLDEALGELARCGLFPVAWTRPDGTPEEETTAIADLCSTVWQRRRPAGPDVQPFPFLVEANRQGQRVIPDNLRTLREGRGEVETMVADARLLSVIPDAWVTASIAPEAPLPAVELLLSDLRDVGYEFADLRRMQNWTRGSSLHIYSTGAPRPVAEMIPEGWGGMLIGPQPGKSSRFERPGRDGRDKAKAVSGSILLAYPMGLRPRPIFAFEGGPHAAANRFVHGMAYVVLVLGIAACGLLLIIYLAQIVLQRRA